MKILGLIVSLGLFLNASEFYAKLEPLETYNVKASVSGQVVFVNNKVEGLTSSNSVIVELDSVVDKTDLKQTKAKLKTLEEIVKIEQNTLKKFNKIRSKSQLDKDNQKIKVLNLENQLSDLVTKKVTLEDKISKKLLKEKTNYISNIEVKVGDYVNPGSLLYTASDLTKAKLEIFIPIKDSTKYNSKKIYIDGKLTEYKISKLYKVAHSKHISSYKCEIIVDAPKVFSKLVKIEFK